MGESSAPAVTGAVDQGPLPRTEAKGANFVPGREIPLRNQIQGTEGRLFRTRTRTLTLAPGGVAAVRFVVAIANQREDAGSAGLAMPRGRPGSRLGTRTNRTEEDEHAPVSLPGCLHVGVAGRPDQESPGPPRARGQTDRRCLGAKILGGGYSYGKYDIAALVEAPDDVTMAAVAVAIAAGGAVKAAKTTPLLSGAQWVAALKKAPAVSAQYRAAR